MSSGNLDARRQAMREDEKLGFYKVVERMKLVDELDRRESEPQRTKAINLSEQAREEIDDNHLEGIDFASQAYVLAPDEPEVRRNLIYVFSKHAFRLYDGEQYTEILHLMLPLKVRGVTDWGVHRVLQLAFVGLGKPDQAIEEAKAALKFQPDNPNTHLGLAESFLLKSLDLYAKAGNRSSHNAVTMQEQAAESLGRAYKLRSSSSFGAEDAQTSVAWGYALIRMTRVTNSGSWFGDGKIDRALGLLKDDRKYLRDTQFEHEALQRDLDQKRRALAIGAQLALPEGRSYEKNVGTTDATPTETTSRTRHRLDQEVNKKADPRERRRPRRSP